MSPEVVTLVPGPVEGRSFSVVCIVASAGGLEALRAFFHQVPADSGLAFLVLQHQPPDHASLLPDLLGAHSALPFHQGRLGDPVLPNRAYVLSPGMGLARDEVGALRLAQAQEPTVRWMPGDGLMGSASALLGRRVVGVVLSGTGSDGTAGLRAIKVHGGLTMAQSPSDARYDSMPGHACEAADFVLPASDMPGQTLERAGQARGAAGEAGALAGANELLQAICAILQRKTGHDFSRYKPGTLNRRIQRRMQVTHTPSIQDYIRGLEGPTGEAELLLKDLLISVTEFFRDPEVFEELGRVVLPRIFEGENPEAPVRIWIPGCATGEEAYSIAILVREQLLATNQERPVQIFATDIDTDSLMQARSGRFSEEAMRSVSPERQAQFFTREGEAFRVTKELRDLCVFSVQNILRDPPFSSLHLISCRNVLIYLQAGIQRKLIPLFHFALRPGGHLLLGPSEGLASNPELFEALDKPSRLFRRREVAPRPAIEFPVTDRRSRPHEGPNQAREAGGFAFMPSASDAFERMLLEDYAPASVIVNELGDILYCAGQAGRFLQPPLGTPTQNLLASTRGSIRRELRTLLALASQEHRKVSRANVRYETEGGLERIRITVRPMPGLAHNSGILAVIFQEQPTSPATEGQEGEATLDSPLLDQLDEELRATRAELQSTVEELESTNEELRSSNEELQSSNEELQTSQEEIQSVNEELATVNFELKQKVRELNDTNSDLQNLLSSTEIATIFLDPQLCITKFTPAATALFGLIEGDLGRPISDLVPRFVGLDLPEEARGVLVSTGTLERQVQGLEGESWFMVRLLPYRTVGGQVNGVVATFVDISELKRTEQVLARSETQSRILFERAGVGFLLSGSDWRIQRVNSRICGITGYEEAELLAMRLDDLIHPGDLEQTHVDRERLRSGIISQFTREKRYIRKDGGLARVEVTVTLVQAGAKEPPQFLTAVRDVTEQRRLESSLRKVSMALEKSPVSVVITDLAGQIEYVNPYFTQATGYSAEEVLGQNPRILKSGETPREAYADLWQAITTGKTWQGLFHNQRKDGSLFWESATIVPLRDDQDVITHFVALKEDITERKLAEDIIRESEVRFRRLFENMVEGFAHCRMRFEGDDPADFMFLSVNEAFTTQSGLKDVEGKWVSQVIPGIRKSDPHMFEAYARVARTGVRERFDLYVKGLDMWFDLSVYCPAPNEFVAVFDVIDERRRMEEERLELERRLLHGQKLESLGVLAGGIAHDFNNLLLAILGNLEVAGTHLPSDATATAFLEQAKRAARRATDLTRQMLDYSGRGAFTIRALDLNVQVEENIAFFRAAIPKTHGFKIDLAPDLPPIQGDSGQIQQIIMNLITNAAEAIEDQGLISLSTRMVEGDEELLAESRLMERPQPGRFACLEVKDNGAGMDGEVLKKVFDPFFTTKATGRGLGMSALLGIVRGHRGAILVDSQPGEGTSVRVLFPASTEDTPSLEAEPEAQAPKELPVGQGTILVVDDEAMVLDINMALLERLGYPVRGASGGEEALRLFSEAPEQYFAALLDLSMPGMDGIATLMGIRAIRKDLPVILASGFAEGAIRSRIPHQGDHLAFIQKPFDLASLKEKLGVALGL